jgi:hypothetical protein
MFSYRWVFARLLVAGSLMVGGVAATYAAGALAVGNCGAYGFAFDYTQEHTAHAAALRKCAGDCKVVTAMKRNCAALAVDGRNVCGAYGFAAASRLGPAQNHALRQCYEHGGKDCMIRAFVCDAKG